MPSKRQRSAALLAALLLLSGCRRTAQPTPAITPTPTPTAEATPTPTPAPSEEPKELWGFPIDDTHDAFEVPTGGKLGTVLVTVEMDEQSAERYDFYCTLSVWCEDDLSTPIQTMMKEGIATTEYRDLLDANFDGYTDFCYVLYPGVKNNDYSLYTWDEEQGQFRFVASFLGHDLELHEETQTLVNWSNMAASDKVREEYRWEDDKLVCFRKEEYEFLGDDLQSVKCVTYDWIDGQWQEVSREIY